VRSLCPSSNQAQTCCRISLPSTASPSMRLGPGSASIVRALAGRALNASRPLPAAICLSPHLASRAPLPRHPLPSLSPPVCTDAPCRRADAPCAVRSHTLQSQQTPEQPSHIHEPSPTALRGDRRAVAARSWFGDLQRHKCRGASNSNLIEQAAAASLMNTTERGKLVDELTACGYAATYDIGLLPRRPLHFALVRDPLDRFIAGHADSYSLDQLVKRAHQLGQLGGGRGAEWPREGGASSSQASDTVASSPKASSATAEAGGGAAGGGDPADPLEVVLVPSSASVYTQTQSYSLAATDAAGVPIWWDALVRIERLDQELPPLLRAIFGTGSKAKQPKDVGRSFPTAHKQSVGKSAMLKHLLLNRNDDTVCHLCRYLAQDYICLGYSFPPQCYLQRCRATMSPIVSQAMVEDCEKKQWPPYCLAEGVNFPRIMKLGA